MENKFTDNEIVKALECCCKSNTNDYYCEDCPYEHIELCAAVVSKDALDLINRQKAMIDGLIAGQETLQKALCDKNAEIERLQSMNQAKLDTIHDLMAEVENLKKFCNDFSETLSNNCKKADLEKVEAVDKAKSEARKEFWDKLWKKAYKIHGFEVIDVEDGDNLLKEMEGKEVE